MDTLPKLTPTQALRLRAAARRADGGVIPPDNLRGGARVKAVTALVQREWIAVSDGGFVLTDAGYPVAGRNRPAPPAGASRCARHQARRVGGTAPRRKGPECNSAP